MNNTAIGILSAILILGGSWLISRLACAGSGTSISTNFSVKDSDFSTEGAEAFTFNFSGNDLTVPSSTNEAFGKIAEYLQTNENRGLNLIGNYYYGEKSGEITYDNLGIARAEKVKSALTKLDAPEEAITVSGQLISNVPASGEVLYNPVSFSFFEVAANSTSDISVEDLAGEVIYTWDEPYILYFDEEVAFTADFDDYFEAVKPYFDENPNAKFQLTGYFFSRDNAGINKDKSERDAKNVRDELRNNRGIPRGRILPPVGRGQEHTKGSDNRVEIVIIN